ncbi:L-lactate transport [Desulfosporosinus acidiphilus SJ4]|uniref:L-lactate permease n=1 Tax=Desulfosporosinus acidiphilus (strain DSM 22704 / JCM 16185 / SJ4) TaxID=646529 RepID=I4D4Q7_DESAJ|nr:lactate permease LctP family transporter [Desulfosporosinus acidiphilus]AFM40781.1 L-lactate transport [Desulfosporosinus acidiphilus SJ4]
MHWSQVYAPVGNNLALSSLVAAIPILLYLVLLAAVKLKGHVAGIITLIVATIIAVTVYGMPVSAAVSSDFLGAFTGLWPIGIIIVAAVFLYKMTVKTGHFDVVRDSIAGLTNDRRLQMLLVAFSFGAFLEGVAGFGAPVAIAGAVLVGLGFDPLYAAGLCLIADTAPVAFGAIGVPITAVAAVVGIDPHTLGAMVGRQLPFISIWLPFYLVWVMAGWKRTIEVLPAVLTVGITFAVVQFLSSNYLGPQLPDVLASLSSLFALTMLLKVWKPKTEFHFPNEKVSSAKASEQKNGPKPNGGVVTAWMPYLILSLTIVLWNVDAVKKFLTPIAFIVKKWPALDMVAVKVAPLVAKPTPIPASFSLNLLNAGPAILVAAFISMFIIRMSFGTWLKTLGETIYELRWALLTIAIVVGLGQLFNSSGMSATLGLAFAKMGSAFPFFAPVLGWLGVFLTGSDTSSNLLFGGLQKVTAQQIGVNPVLTVAANSSGGVMGKMISPQSISVGTSATGLVGQEGALYRFTLKHSLFFLLIVMVICYVQAYFLPWMIP